MQFTYTPEGADTRKWPFQPGKLMNAEVEAIERQTGLSFRAWVQGMSDGSVLAIHGFLYVMLKRSIPNLKWDDVQFCMDEVNLEMEDDEIAQVRESIEKKVADGTATKDDLDLLESLPEVEVPKEETETTTD